MGRHVATATDRACSFCGAMHDVSFAPDPYASDVGNDPTPVWICDACAKERALEV